MQGRGASTCPSDHECTEVVAWKVRIQKIVRYLEDWCCQTGLNCRPLHYQWSALPLSYGSMPGIEGNRPKWPPTRRPVLATRASLAQARGQAGKGPKSSKTGACCWQAPSNRSTARE